MANSQSVVERDHAVVTRAMYRYTDLAFARGEGVYLYDFEGRRYYDFAAGIATMAVGHSHPRVVAAITAQAQTLIHSASHVGYNEPYIALLEKLRTLAPGKLKRGKGMLVNSGGEAVEAAIKLARMVTNKPMVIAFHESFHGRPMGALALTASSPTYRKHLSALLPGVYHTPYPSPHSPIGRDGRAALDLIEYALKTVLPPDDVAAIVFEPIVGEGGYYVPPDGFLEGLRALCDKYKFLLIADEVQTGLGRTGKWFGVDNWNVEPDIMALGKAVGGGLPLGAILARADLADAWEPAAHGSTFGGNPVACRAGLETINIIEEENLLDNARRVGELIESRLRAAQEEIPTIGDVRGKGLMLGAEIVDAKTGVLAKEKVRALVKEISRAGVVMTKCGDSTLRFAPPLILNEEQARDAIEIVFKSLGDSQ